MTAQDRAQEAKVVPLVRRATLLAHATVLMPLITAAIRRRGVGWAARCLRYVPAVARRSCGEEHFAIAVGTAARTAARLWRQADATCLAQSVLCWSVLTKNGSTPTLKIAVPDLSRAVAHAWVELNGQPVTMPPTGSIATSAFAAGVDPTTLGVGPVSRT